MLNREWILPLLVPAVAGAIWCLMFGPLVAAAMLAGCYVLGSFLAPWLGRKMFGEGGQ